MKTLFFSAIFLLSSITMCAQIKLNLWDTAPTPNGLSGDEVWDNGRVSNVSVGDLTIYSPNEDVSKNAAVIICPGGGYGRLAITHEGSEFANWLCNRGITAVVLKYRMPNGHKEVPLDDVQQAIRIIRSKAADLNILPNKIGVAGFSAGGHLAAMAATRIQDVDLRPDFSILFYPVISMKDDIVHKGSRTNLLGANPLAAEIMDYSNEQKVSNLTPPTLIFVSDDDKSVSPINSIQYYEALKQHGIASAMYIFPTGGHGWGMNKGFKYHDAMLTLLALWLDDFLD